LTGGTGLNSRMLKRPKKVLFVLIVVGLLLTGGAACREAQPIGAGADAGGDSDADTDADGDTESDTGTEGDTDLDTDGPCGWAGVEEQYVVPSPEAGIEPVPAAICAADEPLAVSNGAATVSLALSAEDPYLALGRVQLAAGIAGGVVGLPAIEVVGAFPDNLIDAVISDVADDDDGFSFAMEIPPSCDPGWGELTVRVTFDLSCGADAGATKAVSSTTYLHLCDGADGAWEWVASGGECTVCEDVFEGGGLPLFAPKDTAMAALSGNLGARIVEGEARGRKVALSVEHRGAEGAVRYSWRASGGTITGQGEAAIVWEAPREPGPHLVQVAVRDKRSAAVAALRWRHR
jgi:hypothetical protein